jgi:protein tyrosine phosphatase (PTP) superfamily phosphohydrolase (DUF442 family)
MDISQITDVLYLGKTPAGRDYDLLRSLGVRLVINMRVEKRPAPDLHLPWMATLWLPSFDSPLIPISVRLLRRGVNASIDVFRAGGGVYVHCAGGVHRGAAMSAAILIAQGMEAEEAIGLIEQKRKVARPSDWYIKRRILKFAREWNHDRDGV